MTLDQIKAPIADELDEFETRFRESMRSKKAPLLDKITWYIVQRKGKQVRPMLVLLSARLFGPINNGSYVAASLVELLHTASLVHDDVVDDANERRGFFSINALWKNKIAVLVGDYLLAQGLLLSVRENQYRMLEMVSRAVQELSEGELLQMEKARRLDIKEEIYFEIIRQKTASLIAAACCSGAISTAQSEEHIQTMWKFGEKTGMAFQIRDDLFDFGADDVGKPLGIDIKEKKLTLPLIYALDNAPKAEKKHIMNLVKNHSHKPDKVAEVIAFVRNSGGIPYAKKVMEGFRQEALDLLYSLPDSPARAALAELLLFVTERSK